MSYRIIIYNVSQDEYEQAITLAAHTYKARYGAMPENVTLPAKRPESLVCGGGYVSVGDLRLEIDKNFASPGTCQVGR